MWPLLGIFSAGRQLHRCPMQLKQPGPFGMQTSDARSMSISTADAVRMKSVLQVRDFLWNRTRDSRTRKGLSTYFVTEVSGTGSDVSVPISEFVEVGQLDVLAISQVTLLDTLRFACAGRADAMKGLLLFPCRWFSSRLFTACRWSYLTLVMVRRPCHSLELLIASDRGDLPLGVHLSLEPVGICSRPGEILSFKVGSRRNHLPSSLSSTACHRRCSATELQGYGHRTCPSVFTPTRRVPAS